MRIFILVPYIKTGGPENLYQLCDAINRISDKFDAFIIHPDIDYSPPPILFSGYVIKLAAIEDITANDVVIVPETLTGLLLKGNFKYRIGVIFWLSVDNYFGWPNNRYSIRAHLGHLKRELLGEVVGRSRFQNYLHITQSRYASTHLKLIGQDSYYVGDYISDDFSVNEGNLPPVGRKCVILFNPRKDHSYIHKVIAKLPDLNFLPLSGYSSTELKSIYDSSLVYLDFGYFPGSDRMCREAALSGCVVLTGRFGASSYYYDSLLGEEYTFDVRYPAEIRRCGETVRAIINSYQTHLKRQSLYRELIVAQKDAFRLSVERFFRFLELKQ